MNTTMEKGVSNPFRYEYKEAYLSVTCVYKLWFGQKYFIWKGKALRQSVNMMAEEIDRRLRLGAKDGSMLEKVVKYIKKSRVTIMKVEMVFQTNSQAELLLKEYELLLAGAKDDDCLNVTFEPYVPGWMSIDSRQALAKAITDHKQSLIKKKKPRAKKSTSRIIKAIRSTKVRATGRGNRK